MHKVLNKIFVKIRLLFCKERESYYALYSILGFLPNDLKHYRRALTHSSSTHSSAKKVSASNERLEFLGDAVISSVVSDYLYFRFRKEREGFLSRSRSNIVCRDSLNMLAVELKLDKLLQTDGVEFKYKNNLYGNAFEAFIGAIYIDKGYNACRTFLLEKALPKLNNLEELATSDTNYKSRIIEWAQKNHKEIVFNLISEKALPNGHFFVSEVCIDGECCGKGEGYSKRLSQQQAAKEAIEKLSIGS
ncbi:MAG: ribonuclease III [Bacteroidaceae bacterium]|nr:ribonuclease III [Bacteroidaceae bacterium]